VPVTLSTVDMLESIQRIDSEHGTPGKHYRMTGPEIESTDGVPVWRRSALHSTQKALGSVAGIQETMVTVKTI